jgi:hypothetical protein
MKAVLVLFQFMLLLAIVFGLLIFSDDYHSDFFYPGIFCYFFMLFGVVFLTWVDRPIVVNKNYLKALGHSNIYSIYSILNIRRSLKLKWTEINSVSWKKDASIQINQSTDSNEDIFRIPFGTGFWNVIQSQKFAPPKKVFELIEDMSNAKSEKAKDQIFKQFLTFGPTDEKAKKFSPWLIISSQLVLLALIVKIY